MTTPKRRRTDALENLETRDLLIKVATEVEIMSDKGIPEINTHLKTLNNSVSKVKEKGAETRGIAIAAKDKADGNRRYMDKMAIAIVAGAAAALFVQAVAGG